MLPLIILNLSNHKLCFSENTMDIVIPNNILAIYTIHSCPIVNRQDEQASLILCKQKNYCARVINLGDFKGMNFRLQSVPFYVPKIVQVDNDNYYYMHGRTNYVFIIMVDKKSKKNLIRYSKGALIRRFKVYAKKRFGVNPNTIHSIVMHNFTSIDA